jgi:hypothetical protein
MTQVDGESGDTAQRMECKMLEYVPTDSPQRKPRGRFASKPTRARLVRVAAALSAIAIAAPVSTAAAATAAHAAGTADGPAATLTGPTYITTAPSTFINTNNQVSAASTSLGGQSA